jgi:hypothetical protein
MNRNKAIPPSAVLVLGEGESVTGGGIILDASAICASGLLNR